jgi:hypothetical protein
MLRNRDRVALSRIPGWGTRYTLDCYQQVLRVSQQGARTVEGRVRDQARLLQPPQQFGEGDLRLHVRQRRAEAAMYATATPQMLIIAPLGIEAIRVLEARLDQLRGKCRKFSFPKWGELHPGFAS